MNTKNSKSRKTDISPQGLTHSFGTKLAIFPTFFLGNIGQENVFYDILQQKRPFLAIKIRSSKLEKLTFFQRGQPMVLVQNWPFFQLFFQAIQAMKMCFTIFQNDKTPFQAIKTRSSKSRKIDIFANGLTHDVGLKMAVFPTFIYQAIQPRKMSFTIFYIEKTPLQPMKTKSSKSRKTDVFPEGLTHSFARKFAIFQTFFFQAKQARKMSFTRFQNE